MAFVQQGFYPYKFIINNTSDTPIIVSQASIGGLAYFAPEHVAKYFYTSKTAAGLGAIGAFLGLEAVILSPFALAVQYKKSKKSQKFTSYIFDAKKSRLAKGAFVAGLGLTALSAYALYKDRMATTKEFKKRCISESRVIQPHERCELFVFLTREAYNTKQCNFSLTNAYDEHDITAFVFYL